MLGQEWLDPGVAGYQRDSLVVFQPLEMFQPLEIFQPGFP